MGTTQPFRAIVALAASLGIISSVGCASGGSTLSRVNLSWLGVRLGEPFSETYKRLGDPAYMERWPFEPYPYLVATYKLDGGAETERLFIAHGHVVEIEAMQQLNPGRKKIVDPYGVALLDHSFSLVKRRGEPDRKLTNTHQMSDFWSYDRDGVSWAYGIGKGSGLIIHGRPLWGVGDVDAITATIQRNRLERALQLWPLPDVALPRMRTGSSTQDALRYSALTGPSNSYIDAYFTHRPCHRGPFGRDKSFTFPDAHWQVRSRSVIRDRSVGLTRVVVACTPDDTTRKPISRAAYYIDESPI